jgi:hypothetical protein
MISACFWPGAEGYVSRRALSAPEFENEKRRWSAVRWMILVVTVALIGGLAGTSLAYVTPGATKLPALKIISPANGATIANPVRVVFETRADLSKMTMADGHGGKVGVHLHIEIGQRSHKPRMKDITRVGEHRYRYSLGNVRPGRYVIRVFWADEHHKPIGEVQRVRVTVR